MSTSTSLPTLYETKENIQEHPEIPRINKVTAEDMNIIRELLENCLFKDNENIKDVDGNILDLILPRYSYNLITDGEAVKTGRKIDGADEWVRRYSIPLDSQIGSFFKNSDLEPSEILVVKKEGEIISNSNNSFNLDTTNFNAGYNYCYLANDGMVRVNTNSENYKIAYVNLYYTFLNERTNNT